MDLTERFLRYVAVPTTSSEESKTVPSTENQLRLGAMLAEELRAMGASDVEQDEFGYVYARIPADGKSGPAVGFVAHMDTAPDCSGENIRPRVVRYEGGDLRLSDAMTLRAADYPVLRNHIGKHLIVTDGTTLLGADDKAGVAEIMAMAETLLAGGRPHGEIRIAFTPDEEIGCGTDHFNLAKFPCAFAYTADGGTLGEFEYENFNAASGRVRVRGFSIHPGSAKGRMKNAAALAMEFHARLPKDQTPENTEGYEGFFHLCDMRGHVEEAELDYIIRDHDREKFEQKKALFLQIAADLNAACGAGTFTAEVKDSYYNMKEKILPHPEILERAERAMRLAGMEPKAVPIRGGTDGARLSWEGLPCPNLCTGGENYHGPFEFIPAEDMARCADMLTHLACGD